MTARRRAGSGRTTPKGTPGPKKKPSGKRSSDRGPASGPPETPRERFGTTPKFVARPTSHNRGNR